MIIPESGKSRKDRQSCIDGKMGNHAFVDAS